MNGNFSEMGFCRFYKTDRHFEIQNQICFSSVGIFLLFLLIWDKKTDKVFFLNLRNERKKEKREKVFICPSFILSFDGSMLLLSPLAKLPSRFKPYQTPSPSPLSPPPSRFLPLSFSPFSSSVSLSSTLSHKLSLTLVPSPTLFVLSWSHSLIFSPSPLSLSISISFSIFFSLLLCISLSFSLFHQSSLAASHPHIPSSHFFSNTDTLALTHPHSHATVVSQWQNLAKI